MENKFKPIPFWSWNEKLEEDKLIDQIDWMNQSSIGGFFMHARGGLKTEYLSDEWFKAVDVCLKRAKELNMEAYAYDENGWPSGFGNGELLKDKNNRGLYLEYSFGAFDNKALVSYDYSLKTIKRVTFGENCLNVYVRECSGMTDLLNKDVVKKFINYSYEKYKIHDKDHVLKGFFTDEPQYVSEKYPFSSILADCYKEQYNEELLDNLGLLFIKKDGYEKFRYNYWKLVNDLFVTSYGKQIHDWCHENGYKLTGHYMEESVLWLQMGCCADILPLYKYLDIPGSDFLGRITERTGKSSRQIASVAAQYGKEQTISEIFALSGWDTSPEELKHIADYHLVNGTTLICHHLVPYMEYGQRKRDFPIHFTKSNSWMNISFKDFNDYLSFVGKKLSSSRELVDVAVFYPIRSCYFDYDPNNHIQCVEPLDKALNETCVALNNNHIQYHFLDEKLLEEDGFVKGKKIGIKNCSYSYLIFPLVYTLSKSSEKLIKDFVSNGGKVLFLYDKPSYLEGEKFDFDYLESNTSLEEIRNSQGFQMEYNENIQVSFREDNSTKKKFFFIVNLDDKTETILNSTKLTFEKYESKLINEKDLNDEFIREYNIIKPSSTFKVLGPVENYLTIDNLSYSLDGKNFSKEMYHIGAQNLLLKNRYKGDVYLKYSFESKYLPNEVNVLIEKCDILDFSINDFKINDFVNIYDGNIIKVNISDYVKIGHNEIIIKKNFFESQRVYDILFNDNLSSGEKNTLSYDETIEPIYLQGDFGVYGQFEKGKEPHCYLGNNFYLDEQKTEINSLILDGFPFLRGSIDLEQEIDVINERSKLLIDKRFSTIEVTINDKYVGKMIFNHQIDISFFVKKGRNKLRLKVYVSNRNLLGPHHVVRAEEEKACEIDSFEMIGTWEDGESSKFRKSYSFVENII